MYLQDILRSSDYKVVEFSILNEHSEWQFSILNDENMSNWLGGWAVAWFLYMNWIPGLFWLEELMRSLKSALKLVALVMHPRLEAYNVDKYIYL